jgi:hypothetical protein
VFDSVDGEKIDVYDADFEFQFVSVQKFDSKEIQGVNVKKELEALEKFLSQKTKLPGSPTNYEVLTSPITSFGKEAKAEAKRLKADIEAKVMADFKLPIKKQLLDQFVKKLKSPLAADDLSRDEDVGIEGVVLRNPVSGEQVKLVDKDTFTTLNKFNQVVRGQISGIVKTTDMAAPLETRGGIMGELKILIADLLGNKALARAAEAKKVLKTMAGKTPEETIRNLSKELEGHDDYRSIKRKAEALADAALTKLKELKDDFVKNRDSYQLKLKDGKTVGLTPETIRRTMTAFAETKRDIEELKQKIRSTKGQVQLVAIMYGQLAQQVHKEAEAEKLEVKEAVFETTRLLRETSQPARRLEPAMKIANNLGISLFEKPSYFDDFVFSQWAKKYNVTPQQIQQLAKELKKHGHRLKLYTDDEIWGREPRLPVSMVKELPPEEMALVKLGNGDIYLIDTTGASTYIRFWAKVVNDAKQSPIEEQLLEKRIFTDKSLYAGKDAWTILNIYFSTYMMAAVIIKAHDMIGIRLLRDKTHMRLKSWSREMSAFNFWGYPIWRSSSPAVKKLVGAKTAKDIFKVVRHVPPMLWKLMHIDMSFGKEVPIEWEEHRKLFWLLQKHPGMMTDRINKLFDGVMRYEELSHDEKIKLHEKLYYYVMQFNQYSPLLTRIRAIYNNLLNNPADHNQQFIQEMKLLKQVTAIAEDEAGGEATSMGAISNSPTFLFGEKRVIRRIKRTDWKTKKFPRPTPEKEKA